MTQPFALHKIVLFSLQVWFQSSSQQHRPIRVSPPTCLTSALPRAQSQWSPLPTVRTSVVLSYQICDIRILSFFLITHAAYETACSLPLSLRSTRHSWLWCGRSPASSLLKNRAVDSCCSPLRGSRMPALTSIIIIWSWCIKRRAAAAAVAVLTSETNLMLSWHVMLSTS